jgi:hypothetical protein
MQLSKTAIEQQIRAALTHVEAEEGLYFNNLIVVHEEEERPIVVGDESEVREALEALVSKGEVKVTGEGDQRIYTLVQ